MKAIETWLLLFLDSPLRVALAVVALVGLMTGALYLDQAWFYAKLILKSLRRNTLRSTLTGMATFVLVLVVTMIWTVLFFLDKVTAEKARDLKAIVTERWQIPSQMPLSYAASLESGAARRPGDVKVTADNSMTWSFVGGTTDVAKRTRDNIVFFFAMEPRKLMRAERDKDGKLALDKDGNVKYNSMMDGMDELSPGDIDLLDKACREMERDMRKVVVGKDKLESLKKKVGDMIRITCLNYPGVELEMEIIGQFPDGRYNQSSLMNRAYIQSAMEDWARKNRVSEHPMARKSLNLVWVRVPDNEAFRQVSDQIMDAPDLTSPAVKIETASSGVASFLDAYKDLLWGMRWLFVPAILVTMSMVIANAISISVRERRTEMAVLKVLGFGPNQVLLLVLGEALLIGVLSGLASAGIALVGINYGLGGIKFPIAFFPAFRIPWDALWWGPAIGGGTAFAGSILPAWSARSVKVAEVFSKIS